MLVAALLVGSIAVVAGPAGAATDECTFDVYDSPDLDREWEVAFEQSFETADGWTGGEIARIGGTGDCSLVVVDGETATLRNESVEGSAGVLTAIVDLGRNGTLQLEATNSTANATVSLANDGPAYGTTMVLAGGGNTTELSTPDGRFVSVAVVFEDSGTARVAVWDPEDRWDREWDATVEGLPTDTDWRLRLDGRVSLDGLAIGSKRSASGSEDDSEEESDPDGEVESDDDVPAEFTPPGQPPRGSDGGSGLGTAIYGFLFVLLGGIGFQYAYGVARFGEQMDAIGSTTPASEVEPADWKVALTKVGGAALALIGLAFIGAGLL